MQKSVIILAALILVLTACAPTAAPGDTQAQVETAVALTVDAQNQIGTSVALTVAAQNPTGTATPTVSPTGQVPPTLTPVIPTITPIVITPPTASGGGVRPKPQFACDVIHQRPFDNSEFNPGADFDIKWTILNTGTKSWYQGFDVKYLSGPNMTTTGLTRIQLPAMDPGDQYDIVFDAKAPMEKGFHVMTWVVDGPTCYPYVAIIVK
jgi:Ig-like domain from next to BRCA1 gene